MEWFLPGIIICWYDIDTDIQVTESSRNHRYDKSITGYLQQTIHNMMLLFHKALTNVT